MIKEKYKAVVLLSGGIDSTVALVKMIKRVGKDQVLCLIIDYQQKQRIRELKAAWQIAQYYEVDYMDLEVRMPNRLNDKDAYLPGRNAVFLSLACAWAEHFGAEMVSFGANNDDYQNYPDCRVEWITSFIEQLNSSEMKVRVVYDLLNMSKAGVIAYGKELGVPFELTWSCYNHGAEPCGECDACKLRAEAFKKSDTYLEDKSEI